MSDVPVAAMIVTVTIIIVVSEGWHGKRAEKDKAEKRMLQRFDHETPNVLDRAGPSGPRSDGEGLAGDGYSLRAKPLRFGGVQSTARPPAGTNNAMTCFDSRRSVAVATVAARMPPVAASRPPRWIERLLHRREPTLFQRCLALHIANASEIGGALR
jgi:hypothetical protein